MKTNPVVWFEIYVEDLDRAKQFYEAVLNIKLEQLQSPNPAVQMLAFPHQHNAPGAAGALVKMAGVVPGGGGTLVYFPCQDCGVEASRAAQNGGQICRDKFSIAPYGDIALVSDTEGNMIGLYTPPADKVDCD